MPERGRRRSQPGPDNAWVAREAKDLLLKRMAAWLAGGFTTALDLGLPPIVAALPNEVPLLEVRSVQPDALFRLADDSLLHLEFQISSSSEDLWRFARYNFALSEQYAPAAVYTVVLYGPAVTDAPSVLQRGSYVFTVRNRYLGQRDAEAVVARLRDRVARGELPDPLERVDLALLPLLRQRRPLSEVLYEVAALSATLPRVEREELVGTMVGLAYNHVDREVAAALLEVLRMTNVVEQYLIERVTKAVQERWEQTLQEGRQKGLEEGIEEGRQEGLQQGRQVGLQEGRQVGLQEGRQVGLQEGRQVGLQEGRQVGLQEGRRIEARRALLAVLVARFGTVAEPDLRRIEAVDDPELLTMLVPRAAIVATLADFWRTFDAATAS